MLTYSINYEKICHIIEAKKWNGKYAHITCRISSISAFGDVILHYNNNSLQTQYISILLNIFYIFTS